MFRYQLSLPQRLAWRALTLSIIAVTGIGSVGSTFSATSDLEDLSKARIGAEPTNRASLEQGVEAELTARAQVLRAMDDVQTFKVNREHGVTEARLKAARVAQVSEEIATARPEDLISRVSSQLSAILPHIPPSDVVVLQDSGMTPHRQAVGCPPDPQKAAQNPECSRKSSRRIRWYQVVHGVRMEQSNLTEVDADGSVLSVMGTFVDPAEVELDWAIGEAQAKSIAFETVRSALATTDLQASVSLEGEDLGRFLWLTEDFEVEAVWKLRVTVMSPGPWQSVPLEVHIDGTTGQSRIMTLIEDVANVCRNISQAAVECKDESIVIPGFPPTTLHFEVQEVFVNGACVNATLCAQSKFATPKAIVEDFTEWLSDALNNAVSDPDIMADSNLPHALPTEEVPAIAEMRQTPGYSGGTETIYIPSVANTHSAYKAGVYTGNSREVMGHETAHHAQKKINPSLDDARRRTTEDNIKRWGKAISEGTADALAALYERSLGRPESDAWVIAEDVLDAGRAEIRDLRAPASFKLVKPDN